MQIAGASTLFAQQNAEDGPLLESDGSLRGPPHLGAEVRTAAYPPPCKACLLHTRGERNQMSQMGKQTREAGVGG